MDFSKTALNNKKKYLDAILENQATFEKVRGIASPYELYLSCEILYAEKK